jgi:hypothetical protein
MMMLNSRLNHLLEFQMAPKSLVSMIDFQLAEKAHAREPIDIEV